MDVVDTFFSLLNRHMCTCVHVYMYYVVVRSRVVVCSREHERVVCRRCGVWVWWVPRVGGWIRVRTLEHVGVRTMNGARGHERIHVRNCCASVGRARKLVLKNFDGPNSVVFHERFTGHARVCVGWSLSPTNEADSDDA